VIFLDVESHGQDPWRGLLDRLVCGLRRHPNAQILMADGRMFRRCPDCDFESPGIPVIPKFDWALPGDPNGPKVPVGLPLMQPDLTRAGTRRLLEAICDWPDETPRNESHEGRGPFFTADERKELFTGRWRPESGGDE